MATNRKAPADQTIDQIRQAMVTVPWDAQIANRIADILARAGYQIPEPATKESSARCPTCQRTDEISIRETFIALHPYDADKHEAELVTVDPDEDEGEGDYLGYCSSCGTKAPLEAFGIPSDFTWEDHD